MWPSMVTHTRNLCSDFNLSKMHTNISEHTQTVNTHPEQWAAIYAAEPREQLGVRCLAQGHLSCGIEGGESAVHSLPPHLQFLPARDSNSQPLGYKSDSLTIRPTVLLLFYFIIIVLFAYYYYFFLYVKQTFKHILTWAPWILVLLKG